MAELPTGTVTFLFSDIEGSTRLASAMADRWPVLLGRHQELLRMAFGAHDGVEIATEGDSFFVVFRSAPAAVAAAADAQRALGAEAWPSEAPVRVRMGLHTGEATLGGDNYVGLDIHRAARLSAFPFATSGSTGSRTCLRPSASGSSSSLDSPPTSRR